MAVIITHNYPTPLGDLLIGSYASKLCLCDWVCRKSRKTIDKRLQKYFKADYKEGYSDVIHQTVIELEEYFKQERTIFEVPLILAGTDFQQKVWNKLQEIPYGVTETYSGLSRSMGQPRAIRAIASATGANAISILIPCHRIIGIDGKLIGYAGGLPAKKQLLDLEQNKLVDTNLF